MDIRNLLWWPLFNDNIRFQDFMKSFFSIKLDKTQSNFKESKNAAPPDVQDLGYISILKTEPKSNNKYKATKTLLYKIFFVFNSSGRGNERYFHQRI